MTVAKFGDRLMALMPKLMREMHVYQRNLFTSGDISFPQLWALDYLHDQRRCTMHQLAHAMHAQQSTTTGLVDRMAKLNMVRRERSRQDRRVVNVSLSDKGRSVLRQIYRQRRAMTVRLFSRMPPRDRVQYLNIIERLVQQFQPQPAEAGRTSEAGR